MDKRQTIEEAIKEELKSANEKFGDTFVSSHEAYAVLLEEIEEAKEDIEIINGRKDVYWYAVKNGNKEMQANELEEIRKLAVNLASEAIQVAAMAVKVLNSLEQKKEENQNG